MMSASPRILLVMPKHRAGDKTFPYGIATIFSTLKDKGFDVDLADCVITGKNLDELVTPERLRQYNIIGIGGLVTCYKTVKREIVPFIKAHAPQAMIMVGGYLGTSIPVLLLKNKLCDVVFRGDAEESILEFLRVYRDRSQWKLIRGIAYLDDGAYVDNGVRAVSSLEKVYIPYHKYMDIPMYQRLSADYRRQEGMDEKLYPMVVELGCPHRCHYCFNSCGKLPVWRSPEHVIEEIKVALGKYACGEIDLMSENMLSRPSWVRRFCELIDENNLKFRWRASGHPNAINEPILDLVSEHGCYAIGCGFENFSQRILDEMGTKKTVSRYVHIIKWCKKRGLSTPFSFIFGYFGEDAQTIKENIRCCRRYKIKPMYFWIQAYPLTVLYDQCLQKGLIKDEERYIESLGDAKDFVINLTNYSDEELIHLKEYMDEEINKPYLLPGALDSLGYYLGRIRSEGFLRSAGRVARRWRRRLFGSIGMRKELTILKQGLKRLVNKMGYDIQPLSQTTVRDLPREACAEAAIDIMEPMDGQKYRSQCPPLIPTPISLPVQYPFRFYKSVEESVHNISMEQYFRTRQDDSTLTLWDGEAPAYKARQRMLHTVYTLLLGPSLNGVSVLDVGCSSGYHSFFCARAQARSVLGIDARAEHEDQFHLLHRLLRMPETCQYRNVDMESGMESLDETFDLVLAQGVMYHVYDHPRFIRNLHRMTRKVLVLEGACSGRRDTHCRAALEDPNNLRESVHGPVLYPSLSWMITLLRWIGFHRVTYVGYPSDLPTSQEHAGLWRAMLVAEK